MKTKNFTKGFSLIELLVVIAILGVLAAVAFAAYRQYKPQMIIAVVMKTLQEATEQSLKAYETTGSYPGSITYGAQNIGGWTLINQNYIASMQYYVGSDGKGVGAGATVIGLEGALNYVEPSTTVASGGAPGNGFVGANELWIGIREINGTMRTVCGGPHEQGQSGLQIDTSILPKNCQCLDVQSYINTGYLDYGCTFIY